MSAFEDVLIRRASLAIRSVLSEDDQTGRTVFQVLYEAMYPMSGAIDATVAQPKHGMWIDRIAIQAYQKEGLLAADPEASNRPLANAIYEANCDKDTDQHILEADMPVDSCEVVQLSAKSSRIENENDGTIGTYPRNSDSFPKEMELTQTVLEQEDSDNADAPVQTTERAPTWQQRDIGATIPITPSLLPGSLHSESKRRQKRAIRTAKRVITKDDQAFAEELLKPHP